MINFNPGWRSGQSTLRQYFFFLRHDDRA